jgi:hypothetical protein
VAGEPVVRVDGARELRRTLKSAGEDLGDLKATHASIAGLVATRTAAAAPRRSGALAGSVRGNAAATNATIKVGGASVPYAHPIHWGWPNHNITANPFAADTAKATEPEWTRIYLVSVNRILDNVKGA